MSDTNERIARSFVERIHDGDIEGAGELLADDFLFHLPLEPEPRERDAYLASMRMLKASFPDWSFRVEDVAATEDRVALRGLHEATFEGKPFRGLEANGAVYRGPAQVFMHLEGERIKEMWGVWDTLRMMSTIGVVEPPARPAPGR